MNEADYQYPDVYHFPPFFTIQPVLSTREKQLAQWRELILKYRECVYCVACRRDVNIVCLSLLLIESLHTVAVKTLI
eukprot:scaffold301725_cov86-Cyclotella_meneghiniana.AAC.4